VTAPLDTLGLLEAAAGLADQVVGAARDATDAMGEPDLRLPEHDDIEHVVVLATGAGGTAGDAAVAVAGPFMAVPVVVHKGYGLPNFVDRHTLVLALSFSGDTEETVEAASQAVEAGASLLAVTRGGDLGALAARAGAPVIGVADDIPVSRAALGTLAVAPLVVLEHLGLFPGAASWIEAAAVQLRRRAAQLTREDNPADRLARRLGRQIPIVYGGGGVGAVAARWWKTQLNLNAKTAAFANQQPELDHDELCGWGQNGDVTRQIFRVVNLRHELEHPQIARRFALTDEAMAEVVGGIDEVVAQGEGPLAQLLDLALFGDFVSLYRATQEGIDPGPAPVVDDIEAKLAT
jgi:glucose/mannose-6-phosphate isomerase